MSVIGKTPFVNRIIDNLSSNEVSSVISLLDHLGMPTHISLKKISDANKGISYVVFNLDEIQNKNVQGILVYSDASHCGLFCFNSTSGNMEEYKIDPVNKTYTQVYEHLTVEELRQVCGDAIGGSGGGGGSISAPVFDAEITEESQRIVVSMSEEDRNDIYSHKYPVVGIHIIDEEENDIVLYFKIRIESAESNAILYDNWDGGDGDISQMELTFIWDGDDAKVTFETHDYSSGSDLEYATNNDIDALFEESEDVPVQSIEFTNLPEDHSIELNVDDVVDMSQYIEVSPTNATDKSYTLTTDAPNVLSVNGTTITVLQGAEGLNANLTVTANDGSGCNDTMIVDILNGEDEEDEEEGE